MVKKIGIVGSRRRDSESDYNQVRERLMAVYQEGDIIVSGGCKRGADSFAEELARELGATIIIHHADWKKRKFLLELLKAPKSLSIMKESDFNGREAGTSNKKTSICLWLMQKSKIRICGL